MPITEGRTGICCSYDIAAKMLEKVCCAMTGVQMQVQDG